MIRSTTSIRVAFILATILSCSSCSRGKVWLVAETDLNNSGCIVTFTFKTNDRFTEESKCYTPQRFEGSFTIKDDMIQLEYDDLKLRNSTLSPTVAYVRRNMLTEPKKEVKPYMIFANAKRDVVRFYSIVSWDSLQYPTISRHKY